MLKQENSNRILGVEESEIVKCQLFFDNKRIIICKNNGEINLHSIINGEINNDLIGHSSDVTNLFIDYTNQLVVSTG